jgi:hypothetical protein
VEHPLFALLENSGFLSARGVIIGRLRTASHAEIGDVVEQSAIITSADEVPPVVSIFEQSASLSLGGGRSPCSELGCRSRRAAKLARFAALYADRVYLHNFLLDLRDAVTQEINIENLRREFFADLTILAQLRPLIEADRITLLSFPSLHCAQCLAGELLGQEAERAFGEQFRILSKRLRDESHCYLRQCEHSHLHIDFEAPEGLAEHGGGSIRLLKVPDALKDRPGLIARAQSGKRVRLGKRIADRFGLAEHYAFITYNDIRFNFLTSQALSTTFLTERPQHVAMLNALSAEPALEERNQLVANHLSSILPFAEDVAINDLLKLRDREGDSFILFRARLNQAIEEYRQGATTFSERDARALYSDVIEPELARLRTKVATAKKDLTRGGTGTLIGATAQLSFGLYTGLIPVALQKAANAIGLTKLAGQLVEKVVGTPRDSTVRADGMYFLWKVEQLPEHRAAYRPAFSVVPDQKLIDLAMQHGGWMVHSEDDMPFFS